MIFVIGMDGYFYFYFVTALAVIYAISVRIVQNRLMDKNMIKEIQEKSKHVQQLYKEAAKHNDKRKMDEAAKINEELMPKMNAMLGGQMKMMVAVLGVFFLFTWVSGQFDPSGQDDFSINLSGNSENYSGSFVLQNASQGFWYVTVKAFANDTEVAMNQTVFFVGPPSEQLFWNQSREQPMAVYTGKESYSDGETVKIHAAPPAGATSVVATLDSGTRFYVDLPVTIPLINLRRIYDSQSWFIFSAVIIGFLVNPVVSLMEKHLPKGQARNQDN